MYEVLPCMCSHGGEWFIHRADYAESAWQTMADAAEALDPLQAGKRGASSFWCH